ncbi:photosystem I subunit H-1, partial [Perilla frutescens var. frutescens]
MTSLATFAATHPTAVKGLAGSSLAGTKLHVKPSRVNFKPINHRCGAVVAKYGDKSVYFDLEDIGNTTGQWDLYGSDAPSPYNSLQ